MRRRWKARLALAFLLTVAMAGLSAAAGITFFRIATGSISGTYFPVGSLIASIISSPPGSRPCAAGGACGVPGLIAVAQTTRGSQDNVEMIQRGEVDSGLSQADIAYWAFHGQHMFAGKPLGKLRGIASLYPETLHVVVRKHEDIDSIADLKGKRVAPGTPGSGTLADARLVLSAYGLGKGSYKTVPLDPTASADALRERSIDAMIFVAGAPVPVIDQLARDIEITLLPVDGVRAAKLLHDQPFLSDMTIPAGTYHNIGAVKTIAVMAQWLVSANVKPETAYGITAALWHRNTRRLLNQGPSNTRHIQIESALKGLAVPLHRGAEQYYREAGLLK